MEGRKLYAPIAHRPTINAHHPSSNAQRPTIIAHQTQNCLTFTPMKILMVCLGNICRSPLAEGILQQKVTAAGLNWVIESAGTNGYHIGEPPHRLSQKVALQHDIDISRQRARDFVKEDFERYDKIYAMAADVVDDMQRIAGKKFDAGKTDLLLNELYPGQQRDVPDPWYGPEPGYHEVFELIDKACNRIMEQYSVGNTATKTI
jgi:protein-tyrosine phosphatase